MSAGENKRIVDQAQQGGVSAVDLQFVGIRGEIKTVTVPVGQLAKSLEGGVWFDGSAAEGLVRIAESDLYLRPDVATFSILPWDRSRARLICQLGLPGGQPSLVDPRHALIARLAAAEELGFDYRIASELEFFLFQLEPDGQGRAPVDDTGYFGPLSHRSAKVCTEAVRAIVDCGFDVEMAHHEAASGQFEIDLAEMGALKAADALITLKWALRVLARGAGLFACFMPKPINAVSGSGLHFHQRLLDRESGANLFVDPTGPYQLSQAAQHFMAGQLAHAAGLCAVVAPVVNSYKRLVGRQEAPSDASWARTNRGALIRIPAMNDGRRTRVEFRAPDPSCNPYLALAAMLETGLDGLRERLPLSEPSEELLVELRQGDGSRIASLPRSLGEALEALEWDPVVREALGQHIYELLLSNQECEWDSYRQEISPWELERYLEY